MNKPSLQILLIFLIFFLFGFFPAFSQTTDSLKKESQVLIQGNDYINYLVGVKISKPSENWKFEEQKTPQVDILIIKPLTDTLIPKGVIFIPIVLPIEVPAKSLALQRIAIYKSQLKESYHEVYSDSSQIAGIWGWKLIMEGVVKEKEVHIEEYIVTKGKELVLLQFSGRTSVFADSSVLKNFEFIKNSLQFLESEKKELTEMEKSKRSARQMLSAVFVADSYDCYLKLFPENHKLEASCNMELENSGDSSANTLFFDVIEYGKVDSILLGKERTSLDFQQEETVVKAKLPEKIKSKKKISVRVVYNLELSTERIRKEVSFGLQLEPKDSYILGPWFPLPQSFTDTLVNLKRIPKIPYSFIVDAPLGEEVVAVGNFVKAETLGQRILTKWESEKVIPLFPGLACGDYRVVSKKRDNLEVLFYLHGEEGPDSLLEPIADLVSRTVEILSEFFGELPVKQVKLISSTASGGRGLPFTIFLEKYQGYFSQPLSSSVLDIMTLEEVIVHELAHAWWGNSVTPYGRGCFWMIEGFTNLSTAIVEGKLYSQTKEDSLFTRFRKQLYDVSPDTNVSLNDLEAIDVAGERRVYTQGALVLQKLMEKLGRGKFLTGLKEIATKYRGAHIDIEQFQKEMEKGIRENLDEFFQTYIYGKKLP